MQRRKRDMPELPTTEPNTPDGRLVTVPLDAAGDRLDGFLQRHGGAGNRSRSEWQRLIASDAIRLNGEPVKASQRVSEGDRISIGTVVARSIDLPADSTVPFDVVYADAAMIVVNKPAGVVVHPAPGNDTGTLVNGLLARFPDLRGASRSDGDPDAEIDPDAEPGLRPGIVHRLDKDTSGLLVAGRTLPALADLQKQMHDRLTEKRYLALVRGNLEEEEGFIDRPIGRDLRNRQRMAVRHDGRASQTRFWVRERFGEFTFVEAALLTGRTHQLRVHFASIGHPVAADATYGPTRRPLPWLRRQFLHAYFLRLRSPADAQEHTFSVDLPAELAAALQRLRHGQTR